ncbi:MAG: type IV pilus assembly protein PilM [Candidatus Saccharimonadales bacterium]
MGNLNFYRDEPLFGLDIGHSSLKAVQIEKVAGKPPAVLGYGISQFAPEAIQNGEIVKPQVIADAVHQLFEKNLVGHISSRRVACSLPTSHTFSRPMKVPAMEHGQILEAIQLEAEQYIPVSITNLYLDYEILHQDDKGMEVLLVAASKKIIDSYLKTIQSLNLEPLVFEPSIMAASRLLRSVGEAGSEPSIVVDIGSVTTDIAIYDKTLLVASTINEGGDSMTSLISNGLHMAQGQAEELKNQHGIGFSDKQQRIIDAVRPQLETLVHEIQKSIRYYSERTANSGKKITQIVTVGGGALMPGLSHYLSLELRLPTQNLEPWKAISFGNLAMPPEADRSMYLTAIGETMVDPAEVTR